MAQKVTLFGTLEGSIPVVEITGTITKNVSMTVEVVISGVSGTAQIKVTDDSDGTIALAATVITSGTPIAMASGYGSITMTWKSGALKSGDIWVYTVTGGVPGDVEAYERNRTGATVPICVAEDGSILTAEREQASDSEVLCTAQDLTAAYASVGEVDMSESEVLGLKIAADVNASENVTLKLMGMMNASDTPFELDHVATEALWTTGATDFTKYYERNVGLVPRIQVQAIAGTLGAVAAFLTGGSSATSVVATWNAVTDGEFEIPIDGATYQITGLDFSGGGVTTMDHVAAIIEAGIRAETGGTETCVWSSDHLIITSDNYLATSAVGVAAAISGGSGTDISGAGATEFMDCETGVGTPTAVVLAADLTITVIKG